MSDILKQIQALQEQFNNLFEVDGDGLGQPAVDVPPSQNKIKKDVKTKNGKAELVSVEDELFPYDGNKREQYRQKILDTINGMIQGTATLEDLLQIVRQKKAPLKEAMELMENIYSQIKKVHGEPEYDDIHYTGPNKSYELMDKAQRAKYYETKGAAKREGKSEEDIINKREEIKNSKGIYKTKQRSLKSLKNDDKINLDKYGLWGPNIKVDKSIARHEKKEQKKAPLKEAMEVLESMINELYPDTVKSALHAHNKKTIELEDKVNKRIGEIFKKHGIKGNTYSAATAEDRQKAAETEKEIKEDPEIKDLHNQQEKRAKKNELYRNAIRKARKSPLEEALSLMEAIINEVSIGALARATENNAAKRKEDAKKSEEGAKKAWASYNKLSQEHPEDEPTLYHAATNLGKVAYRDDQRKEHVEDLEKLNLPKDSKVSANKLFKAADKSYDKRADEYDKFLDSGESRGKSYKETKESRPAKRYTRVARLSFAEPVKSRVHEALDEAIRIFSEITEADHHANKKNPVVKITDKNYKVASGKSLPGPFNKNHVGNYIVYNKDTDASYLVTPDNWKKSKIKRDLERQGKFYEALEEAIKILEGLFIDDGRGDILDDITGEKMTGIQRIRRGLQKLVGSKKKTKKCKACENFDNSEKISYNNLREALSLLEAIINEVSDKKYNDLLDELENGIKKVEEIKGLVATKADKDNLDGIIVKQKHRLEVSKDKRENRVTNRKREEYEDSKKEEGK